VVHSSKGESTNHSPDSMSKLSFDVLAQDVRFCLRSARRAPLFSILAILTLALGIGANTAVFSVVKSALLDGLPYADASQLVRVYSVHKDAKLGVSPFSPAAADDIAERVKTLSHVALFRQTTLEKTLVDSGGAQTVAAATVSGQFFATFGVRPLLGRTLVDADEDAPAASAVAVLSYEAWQRIYGGDEKILGRVMRLDGANVQIVGVMPPKFIGPMGKADVFQTLDIGVFRRDPVGRRNFRLLQLVGRLAPGATHQTADVELRKIAAEMAQDNPQTDASFTIRSLPLRDDLVGETRKPLLIVMASAALVLLIACANLAGALLSRTLTRRREFAVRLAIGAGSRRVVQQLLTESIMLALVGGVAGLAVAALCVSLIRSLAASALPSYATISLDGSAAVFAFVLAAATGIVFGVIPAISVSRTAAGAVLQESSRSATEGKASGNMRGLLVAAQIALSVSLIVGAGLLARNLDAVTRVSLGYDPNKVFVTRIKLPTQEYRTAESRSVFYQELFDRMRALPGVVAVAATNQLPQATKTPIPFSVEGVVLPADAQPSATVAYVTPDYFRALGISLREGRTLVATDRPTPPTLRQPVNAPAGASSAPPVEPTPAVISESMARTFWTGSSAVGQRFRLGPGALAPLYVIVGVVGDIRNDPAQTTPQPTIFTPLAPSPLSYVVIRATGDPVGLFSAVRRELTAVNPAIPTDQIGMLMTVVDNGLARRRLPVAMLTAFGALALVLASVGVYAMFAAMGAAREREFGVRVALGSSRKALVALIVRQAGVWVMLGLSAGVLGVLIVTRLLGSMLDEVSRFDPVTLVAAMSILLGCGAIALVVPVRRAISVDPVKVLR
jgi:putative ABC transport system permease protein